MADEPAVSALPTAEPLPVPPSSAEAAPPTPKSPKTPTNPIHLALAAAPGNIDAFLTHLHRCMQTPSGIDTVLLLVGYSARLSANILDAASRSAIESSVHRLIALAFSLPPNTTFLLASAPRAAPLAAIAIKLATRLRALSALLSESRTFLRSWALLGVYLWGKGLLLPLLSARKSAGEKDDAMTAEKTAAEKLDRTIAFAQFSSIAVFQALENAYFLSSKGVFGLSPAQQGKAARWSVRSWMVFVGLELGRLIIERHRKQGEDVQSAEHKAWKETWRRTLIRNLAWAPLTVHWSFNGYLSDTAISALGTVPGIIGIRQLWKDTA
ncbi:hypothetical protein F5X68DRAFT_217791 [Plectosphaerella plurivora]|uniref:Peroxin 11C n=1 Tax=Plectosphaerella plurivora TaxID=936078 RepID=A0A9P9A3R2_9PEZI|nr:hypothetical protein F5X68DRAFT_217791 [Plectosphaerella plurivora]